MRKLKSTFKKRIDNINITPNFNDIKNKINYKASLNVNVKNKKINIPRFCISSLSIVLSCVFICVVILRTNNSPINQQLFKDITNASLKLEKTEDNVIVNDQLIHISYPMVACGCNLEEELEFTSNNWQVYKDGQLQDKNNLSLEYGLNNYEIVLYKLNEVALDYDLEITVGE